MDNPPSDSIPPELRVTMDTEFKVVGPVSNADLPKLQAALSALPGIESLHFRERNIAIRYDPERVSKAELLAIIAQSGFQVSETESASAAPTIESPEGGH